jgi:protein gp37
MASKSAIEWTGSTWSPVTGCTKVSPGCAHCYIERTPPFRKERRFFARVGNEETTGVRLHPERLDPRHALYPTRLADPIFVCSLADLFHDAVPLDFIAEVYEVMRSCSERTFQVLTKRPERARQVFATFAARAELRGERFEPLPNVWVGVSIENARYTWRADVLRQIPAAVRFLSCEPLLGSLFRDDVAQSAERRAHDRAAAVGDPVEARVAPEQQCNGAATAGEANGRPSADEDSVGEARRSGFESRRRPLDLTGIDWVIAGGESGPAARPLDVGWIRELVDACRAAGVPPFVKQLGSRPIVSYDVDGHPCSAPLFGIRDRKGGDWNEWDKVPDLRIREFPEVRSVVAA